MENQSGQEKVLVEAKGTADKIAVVPIYGEIVDSQNTSFLTNSQDAVSGRIKDDLKKALDDNEVKAIILDINSPGGGVYAASNIYDAVTKAAAEKPLVAYLGEVAASGGYYVALPAKSIIVHPDSITGSIGVIMTLSDLQGLASKIGVGETVFKSGEHKDIGSSLRDVTPDEQVIFQDMVDASFAEFKSRVLEHRTVPEAVVATATDGRILNGQQAVDMGLADALGTFDTAIAKAKELAQVSDATVVVYQRDSFLSSLLSSVRQGGFSIAGITIQPASTEQQSHLMYLWDGAR